MGNKMNIKNTKTLFISPHLISKDHIAAMTTINVLIMISNILSSLYLCKAIWDLKLMKTTISFKFIFALALSDLSIGIFLQPALIGILFTNDSMHISAVDLIGQIFTFTFSHFSNGMILIIAADRFLHMHHLQNYVTKMNNRRCRQLVILNLTVNLILTVLSVVASSNGFFHSFNLLLSAIDLSILIVIFVLYTRSYYSIRNRISKLELQNGIFRRTSVVRSDFEVSKGVLFILMSIFICYFPFNVLEIVFDTQLHVDITREVNKELVTAYYWTLLLVFCFPSCNAILFTVLNRRIRRYASSFLPIARPNRVANTREPLEKRISCRDISL